MRSRRFHSLGVAACAALLALGCGQQPEPEDADRDGADDEGVKGLDPDPDATLCETCTPPRSSEPTPPPPAHVAVSPQFLGFYGDLGKGDGLAPKAAYVVNRTPQAVLVYGVRILDDPNSIYGPGGSAYFSVEAPGEEIVLSPGAGIELPVTFARCREQRSARLIVSTSHPGFAALTVHLSGKYFNDPGL